jgi:hypothetical protein
MWGANAGLACPDSPTTEARSGRRSTSFRVSASATTLPRAFSTSGSGFV